MYLCPSPQTPSPHIETIVDVLPPPNISRGCGSVGCDKPQSEVVMEGLKRAGQCPGAEEGSQRRLGRGGYPFGWRGRGGLTGSGPGNPIPLGPRGASPPAAAARRAAARSPAAAARAEPEKDRGSGHGGEGGREGGAAAERPGPAEQPWALGCRAPREPRPPAGLGDARAASPTDTASDDVSRRRRGCFAGRARAPTGPRRRFANLGGGDRTRPLGLLKRGWLSSAA